LKDQNDKLENENALLKQQLEEHAGRLTVRQDQITKGNVLDLERQNEALVEANQTLQGALEKQKLAWQKDLAEKSADVIRPVQPCVDDLMLDTEPVAEPSTKHLLTPIGLPPGAPSLESEIAYLADRHKLPENADISDVLSLMMRHNPSLRSVFEEAWWNEADLRDSTEYGLDFKI